jgi:3-dehydroquinate synthase
METIAVNLGERSYSVHVGAGLLARAGELLRQVARGDKVAVVTNPTVERLYLPALEASLRSSGFEVASVLLPDGEEYKNLESLSAVYDQLVRRKLDRQSTLVALGGGVIGDLAGFAAATFLRGISCVQVPTTLLAQVDSSIGGKTGINHPQGKNLIGAFHQPRLVVTDVSVLRTLPKRELVAGMAEVVKYAVIGNPTLFDFLEQNLEAILALDPSLLTRVVLASCADKARVVEQDERESDLRAILNFGHTIGHALESYTGYERFLHGEAVAIGMVKAGLISRDQGFCDERSLARIRDLISRCGLPAEIPPDIDSRGLAQSMELDKKSAQGKIKFICCTGVGGTRFHWLSPEEIVVALAPRTF